MEPVGPARGLNLGTRRAGESQGYHCPTVEDQGGRARRPGRRPSGRTMAQNLYGPRVRMGNWNEDVYLEEELMRDFLEKREQGKLLLQRNQELRESLLRQMPLSVSQDGFVRYGDRVMLVSPDHPAREEAGVFQRGDLSLCMTPDELTVQLIGRITVPCGLTAAPARLPVGRNTFVLLSSGRDATGQPLRYGEDFCLGITGGFEDKMLYLSSNHKTLLRSSKKSWLQEVYLTDEASHLNLWQATFLEPQLRLEYEGSPVHANKKLVLYHRYTNRALVAHRNLFLRTYFGKEVEVAAHTYLDSQRVEKPKNVWLLVTASPRDDEATMLDVAKPRAEDTRAVEQAMGLGPQ
ncbi:cilia- and flagella-associated protein 161 isoform X2 [Dipodomys merriami]|uniref:cilia- and flagella-associated protein 161 isoform X2 n=1 Tax=Dipodomys merriami TaxID=94247 RepID=UPI003855A991